ncbi:prefoldin subunit 2 [Passer montanus]|nr:prefoldin subunit 2 [Passer montanus]
MAPPPPHPHPRWRPEVTAGRSGRGGGARDKMAEPGKGRGAAPAGKGLSAEQNCPNHPPTHPRWRPEVTAGRSGRGGGARDKMAEPGKGRGAAPAGKGLSAEQVRADREPGRGPGGAEEDLGQRFGVYLRCFGVDLGRGFGVFLGWIWGLSGVVWVLTPRLVIETLREVDPTRKCFRMVGGVLVERTVKEVLPALESNREQISKLIEALAQQLQAKGRELSEFRERHNIRLVGEDDPKSTPRDGPEGGKGGPGGVLVS